MSKSYNKKNHNENQAEVNLQGALDRFSSLVESVQEAVRVYVDSHKPKRFYKQPLFWTALIVFSGFLGVMMSWQQQIITEKAETIRKEIAAIEEVKERENIAIVAARILILNQNVECPIDDRTKLIKMRQERSNSLIQIAAYDSGYIMNNSAADIAVIQIISKIYDISLSGICEIQGEGFDAELRKYQHIVDSNLRKKIRNKRRELIKLNSTLLGF